MRPWRAAHLMRQTQLQHVAANGDCLVVLGPKNNLAFDYKNEREFALKLPRPPGSFLLSVRGAATLAGVGAAGAKTHQQGLTTTEPAAHCT